MSYFNFIIITNEDVICFVKVIGSKDIKEVHFFKKKTLMFGKIKTLPELLPLTTADPSIKNITFQDLLPCQWKHHNFYVSNLINIYKFSIKYKTSNKVSQ